MENKRSRHHENLSDSGAKQRATIEALRIDSEKAETNYLAAVCKLNSIIRVVRVADLSRQNASKAYYSALASQKKAKPERHDSSTTAGKPKKSRKVNPLATTDQAPKAIGSMVSMLLGTNVAEPPKPNRAEEA